MQDDIVTHDKFVLKLLKTIVLGKKMFLQKKKKSSKDKYVTLKVTRGTRNYISEKLIPTQCLLFYPI